MALFNLLFFAWFFAQTCMGADPPVNSDFQFPLNESTSSFKVTEFEPLGFRLPDTIVPEHYHIRLQPFVNGNFTFNGYVEITFKVLQNTSNIVLHMADIVTHNDTLEVHEVGSENPTEKLSVEFQAYFPKREFYIIRLRNPLIKNKIYITKLQYTGLVNDKLKGLYRSSYEDALGNKRWIAVTQFQPTDARLAFPCFDEPALKAEFTLEIVREANMSSVSNMPLIETHQMSEQPGWFKDRFQRSVKMSTYLVALMVTDFNYTSGQTPTNTLMRVWSQEQSIPHTQYALTTGVKTLSFFENFFSIPFPLPKMDMAALPDFSAGAMENWGLITYRESLLIYNENEATLLNKGRIGSVVTHELAHQWFGNLVTPSWWTDLWLNEGFASYMAIVGQNAVEPSLQAMERFVTGPLRSALIADSLDSSHPISIPVEHPDEISEIFDAISYNKGASVIRMMSHFLTEDTFRKGVTNYLNKYAYSVAKQDDLWTYLTEQAKRDGTLPLSMSVKEIMDTWTLQRGYPVISVVINEDRTATVKQERFLTSGKENTTDDQKFRWWIPLSFTKECEANFMDTLPVSWMGPTEESKVISGMPSGNLWVLFNVRATGFYRVNYERSNWLHLIRQIHTDHLTIHQISRAQLFGDAFQLAKAGLLSYDIPLDMVTYLGGDKDLVPLRSATSELNFLTFMLRDTNLSDDYKEYILSLITPHYDEIGFDASSDESFIDQSKRLIILPTACYFKYAPCIERTKELFKAWMESPSNDSIIAPTLRSTVYCNAIRNGGHSEWQFALDMYLKSNTVSENKRLLVALGCTRNDTERKMLLDLTFKADGPIRKQDASTAFNSIARDKESTIQAWDYLKENWEQIYEYFGSKRIPIRLINIATSFTRTFEDLKERDEFIASKSELAGPGSRPLEQARERIVANIHWLSQNLDTITRWFSDNGYGAHAA